MTASGADRDGPAPDLAALERARRRLYAPGADAEAAAEFTRLTGHASDVPVLMQEPVAAKPDALPPHRRQARRAAVLIVGVMSAVAVVIAVATARPALPQQVAAPDLAGSSLRVLARGPDPAVAPGQVTFQPEGYTVFRPEGRRVAVALRCIGDGEVRISAGAPFDFTCTHEESEQVRPDSQVRSAPFAIIGRTAGDVVWTARVVLLDPPQTVGAIPSFREACATCLSR